MNLLRKVAVIVSCSNIEVLFIIIIKSNFQIQHMILIKQHTIISSQSNFTVAVIQSDLFYDQNFLFKSDCCQTDTAVYAYIVDHVMTEVYIWNDSDVSLIISQKSHIKQIVKYKTEDCYFIMIDDAVLTFLLQHY